MMKKIALRHILAGVCLALAGPAMAQALSSAFYTDGFVMRHSLNPALGNDSITYISIPVVGGLNVRTQGSLAVKNVIFDNPRYGQGSNDKKTTFLNPAISAEEALKGLKSGDNKILGEVFVPIISIGFPGWGGYNTLEINSRSNFGVSLPYSFFEFAKNTGNKRYEIGKIVADAQEYAELALGHSHKFVDNKLTVGAKVKFLFGIANAHGEINNLVANLQGDVWTLMGDAALDISAGDTKFKSEQKEYKRQSLGHTTYNQVNDIEFKAGMSGFGLGFDIGAEYKVMEDLKVNFALLDIGFISWSKNIRAENTTKTFTFSGFKDVKVGDNVDDDDPKKFSNMSDSYADQLADFAHLEDVGEGKKRTTGLGTTMNFGAEYRLPMYHPLSFGLLSTTRFNGNFSWNEERISANWAPLKWLSGGMSFGLGTYGASTGWIVNIHPKGFNFFVGADHILGKMAKQGVPLSSKASVSLGMNITF